MLISSSDLLQIDFACDLNGEVENPDVAQVSLFLRFMFLSLVNDLFLFEDFDLFLCVSYLLIYVSDYCAGGVPRSAYYHSSNVSGSLKVSQAMPSGCNQLQALLYDQMRKF